MENELQDDNQEEGCCPKCGEHHLIYGSSVPVDDDLYYPFTCDDCGHQGKEWYSLQYVGSD